MSALLAWTNSAISSLQESVCASSISYPGCPWLWLFKMSLFIGEKYICVCDLHFELTFISVKDRAQMNLAAQNVSFANWDAELFPDILDGSHTL